MDCIENVCKVIKQLQVKQLALGVGVRLHHEEGVGELITPSGPVT
jgi:hypothetical protein